MELEERSLLFHAYYSSMPPGGMEEEPPPLKAWRRTLLFHAFCLSQSGLL